MPEQLTVLHLTAAQLLMQILLSDHIHLSIHLRSSLSDLTSVMRRMLMLLSPRSIMQRILRARQQFSSARLRASHVRSFLRQTMISHRMFLNLIHLMSTRQILRLSFLKRRKLKLSRQKRMLLLTRLLSRQSLIFPMQWLNIRQSRWLRNLHRDSIYR